jgi:hypothetical protein
MRVTAGFAPRTWKTISGIPAGSNLAKKAAKAKRANFSVRGISGGGRKWKRAAQTVHDAIAAKGHHCVE